MTHLPLTGSATVGSVQFIGNTHVLVKLSANQSTGHFKTHSTELLSA